MDGDYVFGGLAFTAWLLDAGVEAIQVNLHELHIGQNSCGQECHGKRAGSQIQPPLTLPKSPSGVLIGQSCLWQRGYGW
jgi:hypothetical protein